MLFYPKQYVNNIKDISVRLFKTKQYKSCNTRYGQYLDRL